MSVIQYATGIAAMFLIVGAVRRIGVLRPLPGLLRGFSTFGLEYLTAGILLSLIMPGSTLSAFEMARSPLIMFCISWTGFFFGCGLELRTHQSVPGRTVLLNLLEPLVVFLFVTIGGALFLYIRYDSWQHTGIAILTGAFCSFILFPRREISRIDHDIFDYLIPKRLLPLGNLVPVLLLTLAAAVLFGEDTIVLGEFALTGTISVLLVQCLVGIGCGMMLNMLITATDRHIRIVSLMIGVTALGGGLANAFSLSSLFIGMLTGMFVINGSLKRLQVLEAAGAAHAIIEKLFMLLLGTLVPPLVRILGTDALIIAVFAVTLVAARILITVLGGWIWSTRIIREPDFSPGVWMRFAGQGILAAAAAVESALMTGLLPALFFMFLVVLVLTQTGMGIFVMTHMAGEHAEATDA